MNVIKKVSILLVLLSFFSCATTSNFKKNDLKTEFYKGKTVVFNLNLLSKKSVSYDGPRSGFEHQPNVEEAFKIAIEELSKETKIDLKFSGGSTEMQNNEIVVNSEITEILWVFTLSTATMKTKINYRIINGNKTFKINGDYKNMSGGGEKGNLIRSLKIATYSFLKELEK